MKTIISFLGVTIASIILQSFSKGNEPQRLYRYELKPDETVEFGEEFTTPLNKMQGCFKRGAYDLSRYTIEYDTTGTIYLSDVRGCPGIHQSELNLILCQGSITRRDNKVLITAQTAFQKFYVFCVDKNTVVDSLSAEVMIECIPVAMEDQKPCKAIVSSNQGLTYLVALPDGVSTKKIYKATHSKKTVGLFSSLIVKDKRGKELRYPAGDYVLVGGNAFVEK